MTRSQLSTWLLSAVCLAAVGCTAGKNPAPNSSPRSPDEILLRRAAILRAQDRRVVDEGLLAALNDPLPEVRALAARALGRIGDRQQTATLQRALNDDHGSVRSDALFALALLGGDSALAAVESTLADPDLRVRAYAATSLGLLNSAASGENLLQLLGDEEPLVVTAACYAVAQFDNPEFAVDRVIELSARGEETVQSACVYALSRLAADPDRLGFRSRSRARRRLQELATSRSSFVRAQVARGLSVPVAEGEEQALAPLIEDSNPLVRVAAVRAYSFLGAPLDPYLLKTIEDDDERVVLATVIGMSRIKGDDVFERLVDLIVFDERPWIREAATTGLRSVNPSRAASAANGLSKDERWEIRLAAAGLVLGQTDEKSLEIARRLVADPDLRVRLAAIPALAGSSQPLVEMLGDFLQSDDPQVHTAVARAVGWRLSAPDLGPERREEAFGILVQRWVTAGNPTVEGELLDAAVMAGASEPVREYLLRALDASEYRVRLKAIGALGRLFDEDHSDAAGAASERPLEDYVEILRWTAKPKAAVVIVERAGFIPGRFSLRLHTEAAPMTSWNFARMVEEGLYTGRRFARVFPGFITQHGDPDAVDRPGLGRALLSEPSADWFHRGTLAMVAPAPGLSGPEWFYTLSAQPHLLGRYTPFAGIVQNFNGVASLVLPGDYVISIRIYDGDGTEPIR
jgi:HEAT repeat protein/cyclophilin family peptidyl-prolyl cis-trans isomerase